MYSYCCFFAAMRHSVFSLPAPQFIVPRPYVCGVKFGNDS